TRMRTCISARLARLEWPPNCTLAVPIGVRMITNPLLLIAASTLVGIAGFAGLLHLIPRLGAAWTRISAWLCRAPGLDLVVSLFTWVPPTVLGILYGWRGVVGAILGQVLGVRVWIVAPELANRQKFTGLVGHDLIWCLYCDWMTGVYALGGEMLRNVESFWCPIRFASGKKCDNCKLDFPDIHDGWVAPDGTMGDVVTTMEEMYGAAATAQLPRDQRHPWFGHPVRKAVEARRRM